MLLDGQEIPNSVPPLSKAFFRNFSITELKPQQREWWGGAYRVLRRYTVDGEHRFLLLVTFNELMQTHFPQSGFGPKLFGVGNDQQLFQLLQQYVEWWWDITGSIRLRLRQTPLVTPLPSQTFMFSRSAGDIGRLLGGNPLRYEDMSWPLARPDRMPIRLPYPLDIATQKKAFELQRLRRRYYAALLFTVPLEGAEESQLLKLISFSDPTLLKSGDTPETVCRKISLIAADIINIETVTSATRKPIRLLRCRFDVADEEFSISENVLNRLTNGSGRHSQLRTVYKAGLESAKGKEYDGVDSADVERYLSMDLEGSKQRPNIPPPTDAHRTLISPEELLRRAKMGTLGKESIFGALVNQSSQN